MGHLSPSHQWDWRGHSLFPLTLVRARGTSFCPRLLYIRLGDVLGLEVETLDNPLYVSSPLGTRVQIDPIFRDCELEISGILLTVDLWVMDISDFDVILGMDSLTAHRVGKTGGEGNEKRKQEKKGDEETIEGGEHEKKKKERKCREREREILSSL